MIDLLRKDPNSELIDTLWNVNEPEEPEEPEQTPRINRYIMECK